MPALRSTCSRSTWLACAAASLCLAACGETARLSVRDGMGPDPQLPAPVQGLVPTVNVADASGWPPGTTPVAAPGFAVGAFATGLQHPRWLYRLPNGDVLVAETDAPPRPAESSNGLRGFFMKLFMRKAGSATPSADRITLLRDADGDGIAEFRSVLAQDLHSPFGMALVGDTLYVANADALVKLPYHDGDTTITAEPVTVVALPGGPRNHHWTKSLVASGDGSRLYVGVGSNSNVGENGMDEEAGRAAIWEIDPATGAHRTERDEIGSDLVPDYMTSVRDGGFYGWPYSYYGQHVDTRPQPPRPDLVARAIKPDYALGPHTASLGLAFYDADAFPARYRGGAFVGQHGSWNRRPASGYKVIFVPFSNGMPVGEAEDVLTGFRVGDQAFGRPVGVIVGGQGALLVADDVGGVVWRVTRP